MSTVKRDHIYINAFNTIEGIGPQKLFLLHKKCKSFADAWRLNEQELIATGMGKKLAHHIVQKRPLISPKHEWQKLTNAHITLIVHTDISFPQKLREIPSPPFLLYVRGNIKALSLPSVAIVGSRKITSYGIRAVEMFTHDIVNAHIAVISGLALGTDAYAHRATLGVNGTTIAVCAGGIDDACIAPRTHITLAQKIIANNGTLITEYPIGTQPSRGTFPVRNRLMAGLADATIIIEATKNSGTLITANYAHKYKRDVFALPGSIFAPQSYGPNALIREKKASPALCSDDILHIFKEIIKDTQNTLHRIRFENDIQEKLYQIIRKYSDGVSINILIKETKQDANTIASELTVMEIAGNIKNIGNQIYIAL